MNKIVKFNAKYCSGTKYLCRTLVTSIPKLNESSKEDKPVVIPVSIAPEGTILKGLNYHKNQTDPIAKKEDEYPTWLWGLLEESNSDLKVTSSNNNQDKDSEHIRLTHRYQRQMNRQKIKAANFLKKR